MNDETEAIHATRVTPPTIVVCQQCAELDGVLHVVIARPDGLYHHTVTSNGGSGAGVSLIVDAAVFDAFDGRHVRRTRATTTHHAVDIDTGVSLSYSTDVIHMLTLLDPDGSIVATETRFVGGAR